MLKLLQTEHSIGKSSWVKKVQLCQENWENVNGHIV